MLREFVEGYGELLVVAVLVVGVGLQFVLLLGSYDALHKCYGGVVLLAVFALLGLHDHLIERAHIGTHVDYQLVAGILVDGYVLRLVAHGREMQFLAVAAVYGECTVIGGEDGTAQATVVDCHATDGRTSFSIEHRASQLLGKYFEGE